jgi:5-methylcytosine-specific restriction endonuclease McrA
MTDVIVPSPKRCTKCGVEKPATAEYFQTDKKRKSGFSSQCRVCRNELTIRWRENNPDKVRNYSAKYNDENREVIRAKASAYAKANRPLLRERERESYRRNPETKKRNKKAYRERHAEEIRQRSREDYKRNSEKRKTTVKLYRRTEQGRLVKKVSNHKRKLQLKENGGAFTVQEIINLYLSQKAKCWYCSKSIKDNYHIEHRIPISRGGSNDISNIVLSCPECNLQKGNKLPHEWSDRLL